MTQSCRKVKSFLISFRWPKWTKNCLSLLQNNTEISPYKSFYRETASSSSFIGNVGQVAKDYLAPLVKSEVE